MPAEDERDGGRPRRYQRLNITTWQQREGGDSTDDGWQQQKQRRKGRY